MKGQKRKAVVADGCVACGCCEKSCPLGAVFVFAGMYAVVDGDRCVGCGRCADACPAGIISIEAERAAVC
jgi:NAD-dependent dihydropyrimidine dehydrogenase PreA subunit